MIATQHIQKGLLIFTLVLAISCSQVSTEETVAQERGPVKVSYVDNIASGGDAQIMIEGMTCERMCVNAVNKSVAAIPSVEIKEMRFDAEQTVDTLIVKFDASKTNEQSIIEAIQALAGGDTYHVKEVQLSKDAKTSECRPVGKNWNANKANSNRFEVPNFFDLLRKVSI